MQLTGVDSHKKYGSFNQKSEANTWLVNHYDQPLRTRIYRTIHGPRYAMLPEPIAIDQAIVPHDISYWLSKLIDEYGSVFLAPDDHPYLQLIRVKAGFSRLRQYPYIERNSYKNWSAKIAKGMRHETH